MEAAKVEVKADSQVVVNQVQGKYEAKKEKLKAYLQIVLQVSQHGRASDQQRGIWKIKQRVVQLIKIDGILYKRGYSTPC